MFLSWWLQQEVNQGQTPLVQDWGWSCPLLHLEACGLIGHNPKWGATAFYGEWLSGHSSNRSHISGFQPQGAPQTMPLMSLVEGGTDKTFSSYFFLSHLLPVIQICLIWLVERILLYMAPPFCMFLRFYTPGGTPNYAPHVSCWRR